MKKLVLLASFLFTTCSAFADLALPGELEPNITKVNYKNSEVNYTIEKVYNQKEISVTLVAKDEKGKKVWESESIGDREKLVTVDNKAQSIAIKDLDGDGSPEILAGGMNGNDSSFLYVFKYKACCKGFEPMAFAYPQNKFSRDFLVSDLYDPNYKDVIVFPDSKIRAAGKIYTKNGPVAGFYFFELKNGKYECVKTTTQVKINNNNKKHNK